MRTKIKNQTKLNEILNEKIKKIMQRIKNSNKKNKNQIRYKN